MRLEQADISKGTVDAVLRSLADRLPARGVRGAGRIGLDREVDEIDVDRGAARTELGRRVDEIKGVGAPRSTLSLPHVVYSLGLDEITDQDPLDAARPTMVRFLVGDGEGYPASAEIPFATRGEEHQAPNITTGPLAAETASLVRHAEGIGDPDEPFEVRLLRVPALHVTALWLHSSAGAPDLLWRLAGVEGRPVSDSYSREAFGDLLRKLAAEWKEQYEASAAEGDTRTLGGG